MWTKLVVIGSVVSTAILLLVMHFTEPATIGPLGILLVFVLIYVALNGVFTLLIRAISFIVSKVAKATRVKSGQTISDKKAYYYGSVIASAPVLLIGMQSINKLGIYDVFLVALFVGIVCFYIAKRTD